MISQTGRNLISLIALQYAPLAGDVFGQHQDDNLLLGLVTADNAKM